MKKLFTFLAALYVVVALNAQTITDDFESYTDFTINPTGTWSFKDIDLSYTYGVPNCSYENESSPMAFIVFNPSATTPPITGLSAHSGSKMLACIAAITPPNNDWMISPDLGGATGTLSFYAKSDNYNYGFELMKVGYSTTTTDTSAFTFIQTGSYVEVPVDWTLYNYTFPAGTKYVAINCVSDDACLLYIDDVVLTYNVGINEPLNKNVSIYPNPVSNVLHITANGYNKMKIINFLGQVIISENVSTANFEVNVSNLISGVYFVRLEGENGTITKKFVKK